MQTTLVPMVIKPSGDEHKCVLLCKLHCLPAKTDTQPVVFETVKKMNSSNEE